MPTIFSQLIAAAAEIRAVLGKHQEVDEGHGFSWPNYVYRSDTFRRAHLDIVDARATRKLYMLHLTVFPHVHDPSPIFGFDLIAGPNKVTGAFHDFSPVEPQHPLCKWFEGHVSGYEWSKPRNLPEWAKAIFSTNMVAAGNINTEQELDTVINLVQTSLAEYLKAVGGNSENDYSTQQNAYCRNQKLNPHTPKVMQSLGFSEEVVREFIQTCLFPEI